MSSPIDAHDINVVTFRYGIGDDELAVTGVPARADNGISQAWQKVIGQHPNLTNKIVAVYAEWEPTAADYEFMSWNFPNLPEVTFSFARPESGDWDAALQQAGTTRAAAMQIKHAQEAMGNMAVTLTDPEAREPVAIPMLRMATSPPPMSPYRTLLPNQLYVLLAPVAPPTTRGTRALHWVLQNELVGTGVAFDDLLGEAFVNLAAGLQITGYSTNGSDTILEFTGDESIPMPAAAIASPNFRAEMASVLGGDRFLAGITCHDALYVVRADSDPSTAALEEIVFAHEQQHEDLVPTLLLIKPDSMHILAQKGKPPA